MKITILSGSPKGECSITLQYASFIQKKFPRHEMKVFQPLRFSDFAYQPSMPQEKIDTEGRKELC